MTDRSKPRILKRAQHRAWFAVAVLLVAYAVSFLDRQVISLMVGPIKHDLAISDTQIGILQGPAFGVFFAIMGLPLGWLADRLHRVRLIAIAILLWSAMTIASGLSTTFGGLLFARIGVGVGEAALVPAAVSLLSEYFLPERRAMPLSIFTSGISLGLGLSIVLGGQLLVFAETGVGTLPWVGVWLSQYQPWQIVFQVCGVMGLPVAAMVLLLSEPRRHAMVVNAHLPAWGDALRLMWLRRAVFGPLLIATSLLYVLSTAFSAWIPAHFVRHFGWSAVATARTLGFPIMLVAISGNWLSGALGWTLSRRGLPDAPLRVMLLGACLLVPAAAAGPLAASPQWALTGVLSGYLAIAMTFGIATTALAAITPASMRGQVVAIYLLCGNLIGLGVGPPLVGAIADHGAGQWAEIGVALAAVCIVTSVPAAWLFFRVRQKFADALQG